MGNQLSKELILLFLTGIFIFAFQQVFIELWMKPLKEFKEVLKRLESFLIKYAYLSQVVWGQSDILDRELLKCKHKFREYAGDLIASYTNLIFLEKIWFTYFRKINVKDSKKALIKISNYLGNEDPAETVNLRIMISKELDNIKRYLKFDFSD